MEDSKVDIFKAIELNEINDVLTYIQNGEDLNEQSDEGETLLSFAAKHKRYFLFKILSIYGARSKEFTFLGKEWSDFSDEEMKLYWIYTLSAYSEHHHIETALNILELDLADTGEKFYLNMDHTYEQVSNKKEFQLMHFAARFNDLVTLEILLHMNYDVNSLDADQNTPLDYAIETAASEAEELLRFHGGKTSKEFFEMIDGEAGEGIEQSKS